MKFKSKVDWWLNLIVVFFVLLTAYSAYGFITTKNIDYMTTMVILLLMEGIFVFPIYFMTEYEIVNDEKLCIKSGFLYKKTIDIKDIKAITKTHNPLSSAALSTNRIAIYYDNKKSPNLSFVFISPKDKDGFIKEIQRINNEVKI